MDFPTAIVLLAPLATSASDVLEWLIDAVEWLVKQPVAIFRAYGSLLRWAADEARSLFDDYGYWVVFVGMLSENTLFLGLIVPGVLVILLAGLSAHDGAMSLPIAIALGILGTIIGDTLSYLLGRYGWRHLERFDSIRELEEKAREPIRKRGAQFVLIYHFLGYTRLVGPATAGLLKMPYRRWALADHAGAVLWVSTFMLLGYGFGALGFSLDDSDEWIRYVEWILLALAVAWAYGALHAAGFFRDNDLKDGDDGSGGTASDAKSEAEVT